MTNIRNIIRSLILLLLVGSACAQSLEHPMIYSTEAERSSLLATIEEYSWAREIVQQLHDNIDPQIAIHQHSPHHIVQQVPYFRDGTTKHPEREAAPLAASHYGILKAASESAMLYYLTEQDAYAQMAADILQVYVEELSVRVPKHTTITGNAFFDPRTTYPHFALAYDFIHPYLKRRDVKVYSMTAGQHIAYDDQMAQKALINMIGSVLQEYGKPDVHGKVVSNHPILTSPGALFPILCVEDDEERERLFHIFWEQGTAHQNSFKHTILPIFSEQGLWPESLSYGFMPIVSMNLNIIDRYKPELNVSSAAKHIFNGSFLYDYLRFPDRRFVRYGDSKRNNDFSAKNYQYALHFAKRNGYTDIAERAKQALYQARQARGGYYPDMNSIAPYDQYQHLELFWGIDVSNGANSSINFDKKTVLIDHAGVALQRNTVEQENELYGLCGIIGGAHYVHSHVTGISMELYGAGYVMAPNAGLPPTVSERQIPLHEHYFRLYAGNNTVVVNGSSHGRDEGSWKGRAHVWQNTVVNIAAEPQHLEEGIAPEFSFATQYLDDTVNNAEQQRTLSTIRTSDTTGYYIDIFRSRSHEDNRYHDYIYHNIGDTTLIHSMDGNPLTMRSTDRYQNDIGDIVKSPGWRYFEGVETTELINTAIKIRFDIEHDDKYMHMIVPSGIEREYAHALAPPTREAKNGYVDKKTQIVTIRQSGEAWDRPYIVLLEPSTAEASSIVDVEPLRSGDTQIGCVVTSHVNGADITDYILSTDGTDVHILDERLDIEFTGRYGIIRTIDTSEEQEVILYIGEGTHLSFQGSQLKLEALGKGIVRYDK